MKVTAIIDDKTIEDALKYSKASTITEALKVVLKEYVNLQKVRELGKSIMKTPLEFNHRAGQIRDTNREL